jgi:copper(I)-binding protein
VERGARHRHLNDDRFWNFHPYPQLLDRAALRPLKDTAVTTTLSRFRLFLQAWPLALAVAAGVALAHGVKVGEVAIEHPFATPSLPGTSNGAAYFVALENTGKTAERLLSATTPAAARVEIHTMAVDAKGVMRMREIDGIALAPNAKVEMKPGSGLHLMLIGLKAPLKAGTSFPMTLRFEHAGSVEVSVVVQAPKAGDAPMASHTH